jgi:hypothetical protein
VLKIGGGGGGDNGTDNSGVDASVSTAGNPTIRKSNKPFMPGSLWTMHDRIKTKPSGHTNDIGPDIMRLTKSRSPQLPGWI